MESATRQEQIDFFKRMVSEHEPYPIEVYRQMVSVLDGDSHEGDLRYGASMCLQALLDMGFTEDEVNPWKKKQ